MIVSVSSPMDIPQRAESPRSKNDSDSEDSLPPTQLSNSLENLSQELYENEILRDRELYQGKELYRDEVGNTCAEQTQYGDLKRATKLNNYSVQYHRVFTDGCNPSGTELWTSAAKPKCLVWHLDIDNVCMQWDSLGYITVKLVLDMEPQYVCNVHDRLLRYTGDNGSKNDALSTRIALDDLRFMDRRYRLLYSKQMLYNVAIHNDDFSSEEILQTCVTLPLEEMQKNFDDMLIEKGYKRGTFLVEDHIYFLIQLEPLIS